MPRGKKEKEKEMEDTQINILRELERGENSGDTASPIARGFHEHEEREQSETEDKELNIQEMLKRLVSQEYRHERVVPWTADHDRYVEDLMVLCQQLVMVHYESAQYYQFRNKLIVVPAVIFNAVSAGAIFSQWQGDVRCNEPGWSWLIVGGITALATVLTALTSILNFNAKSVQHLSSYRDFNKLLKKMSREVSFDYTWRTPVRDFLMDISGTYDRITDNAPMVPKSVANRVSTLMHRAQKNHCTITSELGIPTYCSSISEPSDKEKTPSTPSSPDIASAFVRKENPARVVIPDLPFSALIEMGRPSNKGMSARA
jgi:hypothetical protein